MPPKQSHTFNILLSPQLFASLTNLAESTQTSRAHYLRTLLRHAVFMSDHHQPICADGGRCVAPHLHPCCQNTNTPPIA